MHHIQVKCLFWKMELIGFRPLSKSGPSTIDIKLPDIKDNIKLKFLENN